MNLDKLDDALKYYDPPTRDDCKLAVLYEAARAFRDQERAKRPLSLEETEARIGRWRGATVARPCGHLVVMNDDGFDQLDRKEAYIRAAEILKVLRTEVVPALERSAKGTGEWVYQYEALQLLTALGLR